MNAESRSESAPRSQVTLYTHPGCPGSRRARRYLSRLGVPFREVDLAADPHRWQQLIRARVFATPCLEIAGARMVGFDAAEARLLLERYGLLDGGRQDG